MNYATLRHLALTCVLLPLLCWSAHAADAPAPWKAGVATAVITPQQAMWMAGYASRTNVSQGKFDDLHAKAHAAQVARSARGEGVAVAAGRAAAERLAHAQRAGVPRRARAGG